MQTIEEFQKRSIETDPKLPAGKRGDVAERAWRLAWHRRQIGIICEVCSDSQEAKTLYECFMLPHIGSFGLEQTARRFKSLLVSNNLLGRVQASRLATEPGRGKMLSVDWPNKMLTHDDLENK